MHYDFISLMDRRGKDAIAVDGVGGPGAPGAPKAGFDVRSAVIFALLLGITTLWKRVVHKDFSPILLILLSAALGVAFFGV